jgi:hypothetical protein
MEEVLRAVLEFMNGDVHLYDTSGDTLRDLVKLFMSADGIWHRFVEKALRAKVPFPYEGTFRIPSTSEHPILVPSALPGSSHAQEVFLQFFLHPQSKMLGGPCARCGRYFLKKTKHQKAYCSRDCLASTTAIQATKRKRQEQHTRLLTWATEATAQWQRQKRRQPWKPWTVAYLNRKQKGLAITVKSISRWVNKGELMDPEIKRGKA